jgi:hypothetical protein
MELGEHLDALFQYQFLKIATMKEVLAKAWQKTSSI